MKIPIFIILIVGFLNTPLFGQNGLANLGAQYINAKVHKAEVLGRRTAKYQSRLLRRLVKKERKLEKQLELTDSLAYLKYRKNKSTRSFKSILSDSNDKMYRPECLKSVDSLRRIGAFIQNKADTQKFRISFYEERLKRIEMEGMRQEYVRQELMKRKEYLTQIAEKNKSCLSQLTCKISKNVFYSQERFSNLKSSIDKPSLSEEKALDYLKGAGGFEQSVFSAVGASTEVTSVEELEKMGYQTKKMLTSSVSTKFGESLQNVKGRVGEGLAKWQNKVGDVKHLVEKSKHGLEQYKLPRNQSFKINPLRCLPFSQRLTKHYSFQTSKARMNQPAVLDASFALEFKQTTRLSYGLGAALSCGLGKNWNNINFTFRGLGYRTYLKCDLAWDIALYMGYERTYKIGLPYNSSLSSGIAEYSTHNRGAFSEAFLMGISKCYKISNSWKGGVQVLYDVWWRDKGLNSPIILRFNVSK